MIQEEYPTEEELEYIKSYDKLHPGLDFGPLIEHLSAIWHWPDLFQIKKTKKKIILELHTGGWSGNEAIILSLKETNFWRLFWQSARRGGHYTFEIPKGKNFSQLDL